MCQTPADICHNEVVVVVKKINIEDEGSKQFTSNYTPIQQRILFRGARIAKRVMLITPIILAFKNFCSNLTKVDSLKHHVVLHDLKKILMIRELHDDENSDS